MSKLQQLRDQWDRLGRSDPFGAVLTDPDKRNGRWTADEFFETGTSEIATVLEHARTLGLRIRFRRALDFGCGVGRVTQALANHFDRCDGVDISPSMLETAARYNRHAGKCQYHLNETTDLGLFADSTFDFVYSVLVLQHMAPEYAKAYLRELVRVLVPGGLLVFQMLSHRSAVEPPRSAPRTMSTEPLPDSAFKAKLSVAGAPASAQTGTKLDLRVTVQNTSEDVWRCLSGPDLSYQVNLGARWLRKDATTHLAEDEGRCPLPLMWDQQTKWSYCCPCLFLAREGATSSSSTWCRRGSRGLGRVAPRSSEHPALCLAVDPGRPVVSFGKPFALSRTLPEPNATAVRQAILRWKCISSCGEILEFLDQAGVRILDVQHALLPGGLQSYHYWVTR